jgi:hypothetical protein
MEENKIESNTEDSKLNESIKNQDNENTKSPMSTNVNNVSKGNNSVPLVYIVLLSGVVSSLCGYFVSNLSADSKNDVEYQTVKSRIMTGIEDRIAKQVDSVNLDIEDYDYPFIGESSLYPTKVRYLITPKPTKLNEDNYSDGTLAEDRLTNVKTQNSSNGIQDKKNNATHQSISELFEQAVRDVSKKSNTPIIKKDPIVTDNEAMNLYDLPDKFRESVPKFSYNGHNYSTDSRKRSVILDGKLIKEGKSYKGIDIVEIKQNYVIMRYNGQSFSQRAMEDN